MAENAGESGTTSAAAGTPPAGGTAGVTGTTTAAVPTPTAAPAASATSEQGPIPYERHKAVLENARKEAQQQLQQFAWAKGLSEQEVRAAIRKAQLVDESSRDPIAFHRKLGEWLKSHPMFGPRLQADAGEAEPEPDLVAENGQKVYSADQLRKWQAWNQQKLTAQMTELVSPLQQRLQAQDAQSSAKEWAQQQLDEARTWEGFADLQASIRERMQKDKRLTLHTAYQRAYQEEYLPRQKQRLRDELVAEMNTKATAGTANPSAPAAQAQPLKDKSWEQVLKTLAKSS